MSKQLKQLNEAVELENSIRQRQFIELLNEAYEQEKIENEIIAYESYKEHKLAMKDAELYNRVEFAHLIA